MLKVVVFDKNMKLGKCAYEKADFGKAQEYFEKSWKFYPNNFQANFWLARAHLRNMQYDLALEKLRVCYSLRPDLGKELVDEWIAIAANKETNAIKDLDEKTNTKLDLLRLRKNIRFRDIIVSFLAILIIAVIVKFIEKKIHFELTVTWTHVIRSAVWVLFLFPLLYRRTVLTEKIFAAIDTRIQMLKKFGQSKYYYWWSGGVFTELILVLVAVSIRPAVMNPIRSLQNSGEWYPLVLENAVLAPLVFGIITCGIIFNYIKYYHRIGAYVVSILFQVNFNMLATASTIDLIEGSLILFYLFLYEKIGSLSVVVGLTIIERLIIVTLIFTFIYSNPV